MENYIQELNRREEICRRVAKRFKNELIAYQASALKALADNGLTEESLDIGAYIEFMKNMSEDEFTGNQLTGLLLPDVIDVYSEALLKDDFAIISAYIGTPENFADIWMEFFDNL